MRIVDCFTDVILYARKLSRGDIQVESADEAREQLQELLNKSQTLSNEYDLSAEIYEAAKFPVVAFVIVIEDVVNPAAFPPDHK